MSEFIEACTQNPINLALSVLLALIVLYWLIVALGAVGMDSLDFDLDFDGEPDFNIDTDSAGGMMGAGLSTAILTFFHVGTVPLLILLSIFVLVMWAIGVLSYPWIGSWGIVLQLVMLLPFSLLALLITKIATLPLHVLFKKIKELEESEQHINLIGQRCIVVSLTADHRFGQVEVVTDGAPLRINVTTGDDNIALNKGDEAVLISKGAKPGVYMIRGF